MKGLYVIINMYRGIEKRAQNGSFDHKTMKVEPIFAHFLIHPVHMYT